MGNTYHDQDAASYLELMLSVPFLTKLISEIEYVKCFKIESAQPSAKIRAVN